jgi:GNAT superfamily N-acetyltransferase
VHNPYLSQFLYELKHPEADFWNSLRESYNGFDDWFTDKARAHRKAWSTCDDKGYPLAVCIYKEENSPVVTDDSNIRLSGKVLKLCTFKVDKKLQGRKLGERLLFTAFRYAVEHNVNYVYLHTKAQDKLIDLCIDFGFSFQGKYHSRF